MIVTGRDERQQVKIKNLDETDLGKDLTVTIEAVYYQGLTGIVSNPVLVRKYNASPSYGKLTVNLPATDNNSVYFITVEKAVADCGPSCRGQRVPAAGNGCPPVGSESGPRSDPRSGV